MPQADGRIVIDATLNTDGINAGSRDISAACKRAAQSAERIGAKARIAVEKACNALERQNAAYEKQAQKVEALRRKKAEMERTKVKSEEYEYVCNQVNDLDVKLTKAIEKQREFLNGGGKTNSKTFVNMENEINQLREDYIAAARDKERMESYGNAYVPQDTTAVTSQLTQEEAKLNRMNAELNTSFSALGQKVADYTGKAAQASSSTNRFGLAMKSMSRNIGKGVLKGLSGVGKKLKSMVSSLVNGRKSAGKMNGVFKGGIGTLLKYGIGIRSLTFLFNKLRGALKDGIDNLVKHDSALNSSLSSMKSSLTQLKNSIASAFSPIITTVVPILNKLIGKLTDAANAVGMFLAALTGKTTYKKATAVQEDYAASLEGTAAAAKDAQQNLSGLDEINTWNDAKSGGGGSSGGGFEDVEIDNEIRNIAELIKQGGWEELGKALVDKLNDMILSIDAKEVGGKIASVINKGALLASTLFDRSDFDLIGDKIGATIVAAVERIDWSQLGHLSVAGVNMLIDFVSGLTTRMSAMGKDGKTGWEKFGDAVSDFINSALKSIKLKKLVKSASNLIKGLNKAISSVLTQLDWRGFAESIASAIGEIDISSIVGGATKVLSNLTVGLNGLLKGLLDNLDWFSLGEELTHAIKQIFANIDWVQLLLDAAIIPIKSAWGIVKGIAGGIAGIFTSSEEPISYVTDELLDVQNQVDAVKRNSEDLQSYLANLDLGVPAEKMGKLELARDLVNDIFTLNGKKYKTNIELEELKSKIEILNGLGLEGVHAEFNDLTGEVEGSRDAILDTIDALKKQYELEAKKEILVELYKRQYDAKTNLTAAEEAYTKAQEISSSKFDEWKRKETEAQELQEKRTALSKEYEKAQEANTLGTRDWRGELEALSFTYNKATEEQGNLEKAYKDTLPYLNETRDALKGAKGEYDNLSASIDNVCQSMVDTMSESGADAGRQFSDSFKREVIGGNIKSAIKNAISGTQLSVSTNWRGNGKGQIVVEAYASGGLPDTGQLFIANEAGPEMVGSIGGRTAVANAVQIVEAVAKGVARAVRQALTEGGIASYVRDAVRRLDSISTSVIRLPQIIKGAEIGIPRPRPALASGCIIPPKAVFSASLGSRKGADVDSQGEDTLRRIIREELGGTGNAQYQFVAQLNRRTIFSEMIEEAKLRQASSGVNPFLLGRV